MASPAADTQMGWDSPFRDAQHSSLAPVRGPRAGATIRWSKSVLPHPYPVPFTVAGHAGHLFLTDGAGTVFAYNSLSKGSLLWSFPLLNATLTMNGTVDMVPIILTSDEQTRKIAVSTCQLFSPHTCVLAVLNENGAVVWSTDSVQIPSTTAHVDIQAQDKQEKVSLHSLALSWTGRIHQVVPANDGDLLLVALCPKLSLTMKNDCKLLGIDSATGSIRWLLPLPSPVRGDLLVSRSNIILVPMCDYHTFVTELECMRIFAGVDVDSGSLLWTRSWNTSATFATRDTFISETIPIASEGGSTNGDVPKLGPYGLQLDSQFIGLVADGVFITLADDDNHQVWAVGTDMASGSERFVLKIPDTKFSRRFVACAAMPDPSKPRQLFFMAGTSLFSMDTTGALIWKNSNISNWVRSMAVDPAGAIYVSTTQQRNRKFMGALDVYDAKGGRYSYSLVLPNCWDSAATNMTVIPTFTITAERWVLMMCQTSVYALYSTAVPFWAWIILSVFFAVVLATIFILGFLYHRKHNRLYEEVPTIDE